MAAKLIIFIILFIFSFKAESNDLIKILDKENNWAEIKIIDKITSRLNISKVKLKTQNKIKDFEIYVDKCILDTRKGFLEISALIQIKDIENTSKDRVFLFNNWMFASNSSLNEIEHPNYDIFLYRCG